MNSNKFIAFLFVLIIPLGFFTYYMVKKKDAKLKVLPILGPRIAAEDNPADTIYHTVPEFSFTAHTGETITHKDLEGYIYVADFFFSNCPGICVKMAKQMQRVQNAFYHNDTVKIISYTVDPKRDDVQQLRDYATRHDVKDDKWHMVTGDKKELYHHARHGYFITALDGDGGEEDFIHSEKFVLVDKEGHIRGYYDGTDTASVNTLVKDIAYLMMSYDMAERKRQKHEKRANR